MPHLGTRPEHVHAVRRERGIEGSNTDCLICAVAIRRDLAIFTADGDFTHFARALRLELHQPRY
jgi:predicted nucleic acid-binding protein